MAAEEDQRDLRVSHHAIHEKSGGVGFAQKYSAKLMTAFGIVLLAVSACARWLQGQLELNHESMIAYDVGVIAFLPILQVIPVIVMTELKLRKQFG